MRSPLRIAAPLAVIASLAAVSPAVADTQPTAHAAGGDAPATLNYPSLVQTRFDRTERALRRATKAMEKDDLVTAASNLKVVRRQMSSAWRGAKYIIRTTPPPPPAGDGQALGDPPNPATGPAVATPADTGYLVLDLQHEVASSMYQLIDGAHGTGLDAISRTMDFALDRRSSALDDILALAPPAPPAGDGRVRARQSDGPVYDTFDIVMPNYVPLLADEIQAIEGTKSDATDLTTNGRRLLGLAENQVIKAQSFVNTHWPPLPPGDG